MTYSIYQWRSTRPGLYEPRCELAYHTSSAKFTKQMAEILEYVLGRVVVVRPGLPVPTAEFAATV